MISRIGKYTVEAELGRGGFGQVYKAWDPDVRQSVAIKVLLAESDPDLLKRFQLEVVTTAGLHHKNIVTIYASGEEGGTPYLVMELLEGQTLGQIIKGKVRLSLMEKVRIMTQVAEGLAFANSKGVVHRDVKPANIMVLPDGQVKIMDFGIALASNRLTAAVTMDGFVVGTLPYMAPEQFNSDGKANEQTDLFSFGDVYYELLTGSHPFEPFMRDLSALRMAILTHDPPPVSQLVADCPEALELLVHRSLAKEREFRYQTFEELRYDSESVLVDLQHDQAAAILRDVPQMLAFGDLQQARARIREAQKLEPGNRQARQMLESIDQKLQEKVNRDRVAARLSDAEKQLAERRFAEAVQNLETAAKLDTTNIAVQMRLADAKSKLESSVQANRLVEDARARQQKGELAEALQRVNRALEIDPDHTEARRLAPRISEMLARRQKDQLRQNGVGLALAHLAAKRFAEALAVVDGLEKEQLGGPALADLRSRIEIERREEQRRVRAERFQLALSRTRETMQAGDLNRASQMLAHLYANFSNEPGAAEVLPLLRDRLDALLRGRENVTSRQRAADLMSQTPFDSSEFSTKHTASTQTPVDPAGRQPTFSSAQFDPARRSEDVAAVLKRSKTLRDTGDLRGALAAVSEARRRLGDEPAFMDLTRELEAEIEKKRRGAGLRDFLDAVRELMASGFHAEAIARITKAKEYAGEAEVLALLDSARTAARAEEEGKFVASALATAARAKAEGDWKRALSGLETALAKYPQNTGLSQGLERLRGEAARERRSLSVSKQRSAILAEVEARNWKKANEAVRTARLEFPGDSAYDDLAEQVETGLREESLYEAVSRIKAKLAANDLKEAIAQIEMTRPVFSRDARWQSLEEEVSRRRVYESGLQDAERKAREGSLTEAERLLSGLLANAPDARAGQMLARFQGQRAEAGKAAAAADPGAGDRKAEIVAAANGVRACLKRNELREAAVRLRAARKNFPNENVWTDLQAELDSRQSMLGREDQISALVESVRDRLKRGDAVRAAAELAAAQTRYPDEGIWTILQKEIDARHGEIGRSAQVAAIAESVRGCLSRDDVRQAAIELGAARTKYPDEALWTTLKAEIEGRQTLLARQTHVTAIGERVSERLKRDALRQAGAELNAARAKYPEEKLWSKLQEELDTRQAVLDRQSRIEATSAMVRERLKRDDITLASAELSASRAKYPDEALWGTLQAEIDARRAFVGVRECLKRGDVKQAAAELSRARAKYPDEPQWAALQEEIDSRTQSHATSKSAVEKRDDDPQAQIAAIAKSVRECLKRNDLMQAAAELGAARIGYPDDDIWTTLKAEIEAHRALLARREHIAALAERIRARLRRDAIRQAAAELVAARAKYPEEALWTTLEIELDARQALLDQEMRG